MADEVDEAQAAGLERLRMGADHFPQLMPPGMFQNADGHHLVVLAEALPHVRLVHGQLPLQPLGGDLRLDPVRLFGGGVDARDVDAVLLRRVEHEAAEAAAHVDHALARLQPHLARDVLHLRNLRFEDALARIAVVGAGVHQIRLVEHLRVELRPQAVVEAGVFLRRGAGAVVEAQAMPAIADAHQQPRGLVEPRIEAHRHELAQIALEVDLAVEVGLQKAHVPEDDRAPSRPHRLDANARLRLAFAAHDLRAVRQHHPERQRRRRPNARHDAPRQRTRQSLHRPHKDPQLVKREVLAQTARSSSGVQAAGRLCDADSPCAAARTLPGRCLWCARARARLRRRRS